MKYIALTKGQRAIIDDLDIDLVSSFKWYCDNKGYAVANIGKGKQIKMHRLINNTPNGLLTDHINGNKLDNRRTNLRSVTNQQNQFNTALRKNNKSGYKGVYWRSNRNRWRAVIVIGGKEIVLGSFRDVKEAAKARRKAEKVYHGEYARGVV